MGKLIKRVGSIVGGCVSGAIATIGTSINIPALGGAIMTGVFPVIAGIALALYVAYGIHVQLKDVDIVRMTPITWQVEVIG